LLVCCASIGAGGHRGVWGVVREGGRQKKEGRATGLDVEMTTVVELAAAAPSPLIRKSGRALSLSLPVCVFTSLVLLRW